MARSETEKTTYGVFERVLYLFLIPVLFTVILVTVLLAMFGYDVADSVLRAANRVPLLEAIVPDPKPPTNVLSGQSDAEIAAKLAADNDALQQKNRELEQQLEEERALSLGKDETIRALEEQVAELNRQLEAARANEAAAARQVEQTSRVYEEMSPSKAAPILEQMPLEDRLAILEGIKVERQTKILEKMDPEVAAETTVRLMAKQKTAAQSEVSVSAAP